MNLESRYKPLVTVQLMTCNGDYALAPRAIKSIAEQDLDPGLMELQIVYDGPPEEGASDVLEAATADLLFTADFFCSDQATGYYTVPRNRALPMAHGIYINFMDADNEMAPSHLSGLLAALRQPHPESGWPAFVYSRREYIKDEGLVNDRLPEGPSPLVNWTQKNVSRLMQAPQSNFVDTGDMLLPIGLLYELAERTGVVWNSECRRFGDWDLVKRMADCGFRGQAVDQVTNIYHWTGKNLQVTRTQESEIRAVPIELFEKAVAEGKYKVQ